MNSDISFAPFGRASLKRKSDKDFFVEIDEDGPTRSKNIFRDPIELPKKRESKPLFRLKESRVLYSDEDSSATYSPPTTSTSLQPSPRKKYKATPTNLWPASELDSLQQYIDKCAQRGLKRNWIQYKKEHKTVKTNIELSIKATSMKVSNLKKVYDEDGVDEEEEEKEKVEEVEEVEEESDIQSDEEEEIREVKLYLGVSGEKKADDVVEENVAPVEVPVLAFPVRAIIDFEDCLVEINPVAKLEGEGKGKEILMYDGLIHDEERLIGASGSSHSKLEVRNQHNSSSPSSPSNFNPSFVGLQSSSPGPSFSSSSSSSAFSTPSKTVESSFSAEKKTQAISTKNTKPWTMVELEKLKELVVRIDSLGYDRDWITIAYELKSGRKPEEVEAKWSTNKLGKEDMIKKIN